MISIPKTALIVAVFLTQLSSSSVLHRRDGRHHKFHAVHTATVWEHAVTTVTVPAGFSHTAEPSLPTYTPVPDTDDSDDSEDEESSTIEPVIITPSLEPAPASTSVASDLVPLATSVASDLIPVATSVASDLIPITASAIQSSAAPIATTAPTSSQAIATYVPSVTVSTASTAQPASTQSAGALWQPAAGATWQIELIGVVTDTTYVADVWDLDLFDVPQTTIDSLHAAGKKVICYFSAGSFEDWRSDVADFTDADKGLAMEGWAGEWWLDTRTDNVRSIMAKRIALAKEKNCDGVDPDNVDGFGNANGVGLTSADGADFLNFLADTAHAQGLSIGLKNAADLVGSVLDKMQWHVNEQCIEYDECDLFTPFINAGKPVFHIEYPEITESAASILSVAAATKDVRCAAANTSGFSTVLKKENLDAWIDAC